MKLTTSSFGGCENASSCNLTDNILEPFNTSSVAVADARGPVNPAGPHLAPHLPGLQRVSL